MVPSPQPLAKEVVLVGGGHAHALLLRRWGMKPVAGARLTVINPAPSAPYTGMLPGHVAGHYTRDELEIDLVKLARHAGARLILGLVEGMDTVSQRLSVHGRPSIPYDIASLDIGITSYMPDIPGFTQHAVAAKPLGPFAIQWGRFLEAKTGAPIVVIGGGISGVELALAMRHRTRNLGHPSSVTIVEADASLAGIAITAKQVLLAELREAEIELIEGTQVTAIKKDLVELQTGQQLPAGLVVGTAGARPFEWLEDTGLHLTDGFITVDRSLRSVSHPTVYAAGDCAHLSHAPRPKAGVFAVRAAPVLTYNIRADLTGSGRKGFQPQARYLKLISLGGKRALTDKWGVTLRGDWVWSWKDRIDKRFMSKMEELPDMSSPIHPGAVVKSSQKSAASKPLCGGCGAKVGANALDIVLNAHSASDRADVVTGPGDDAAILKFGTTKQVISTDHLRAFWPDPFIMSRIAAIHALGDIWAMGAEPQAMLAQIILPRMEDSLQADWLSEIMTAAREIADLSGAAIVGGHTTLGAELTIGFTVTGITHAEPLGIDGGKPGDALILTRAIGSGTLLAGEMAKQAAGRHVADALRVMSTPQGDAARVIAEVAHAMTDVTGFGLAGHLARMAESSGISAELTLDCIPTMEGALELADSGIRSSLFPANRESVSADLPDTTIATLLFDPQTAGGFLAAVPPDMAEGVVEKLNTLGHRSARIGCLTERRAVTIKAV